VIVTNNPKEILNKLYNLKKDEIFTIIDTEDREFLVENANEAISKAYIATEVRNFIILIAPKFSTIAQNKLLKVIEEPPRGKEFILITKSKSSILPTIKSRLPVTILNNYSLDNDFDLDIENLNLAKAYEFIQANKRVSASECKIIIENIAKRVIKSSKYNIDDSLLTLFSDTTKALDMGSPVAFILNMLLAKLLNSKKR
jgi:DNA polymerase-3 subunit delta'